MTSIGEKIVRLVSNFGFDDLSGRRVWVHTSCTEQLEADEPAEFVRFVGQRTISIGPTAQEELWGAIMQCGGCHQEAKDAPGAPKGDKSNVAVRAHAAHGICRGSYSNTPFPHGPICLFSLDFCFESNKLSAILKSKTAIHSCWVRPYAQSILL